MIERIFLANKIAKIVKTSFIYKTAPVGYKEQPYFYNQVIEIKTDLSPEILLKECLKIEVKMGRVRELKNGPRIIDIDLLLWGSKIVNTEEKKTIGKLKELLLKEEATKVKYLPF